jgi:hypothetical protein
VQDILHNLDDIQFNLGQGVKVVAHGGFWGLSHRIAFLKWSETFDDSVFVMHSGISFNLLLRRRANSLMAGLLTLLQGENARGYSHRRVFPQSGVYVGSWRCVRPARKALAREGCPNSHVAFRTFVGINHVEKDNEQLLTRFQVELMCLGDN